MTLNSRRVAMILVVAWANAGAGAAQSVYVAGAVGADIVLVSGQESIGVAIPAGGGESLSGAARMGVVLDQRWGIELEVARGGEIRDSSAPGGGPVPLGGALRFVLPEIQFSSRVTTISTTASIRQQVSDTVALAYLGGIVFHRTDSRMEFRGFRGLPVPADIGFGRELAALGLILPAARVDSVQYGTGPVVGFEAHIGVGDHLEITPGLRMHGLPASWLLRPRVGVGWTF